MKRLYLSSTNKKISGLCGGIGEYMDTDPSIIRLLWIIVTILTGVVPGIIAYLIAVLVIPTEPAHIESSRKAAS